MAAAPDPKAPPPSAPDAAASATPPDKQKPGKGDKTKGGNKFKAFLAALSSREKLILKISGLLIAGVIVDAVVVRPVGNYLTRIDEMIRVEEKVIPKRLLILKYKDKILKEYRSYKALMTDPALSQEEEIARFLREIERVTKLAGLFVSNINPVKTNNVSDTIYELSVDIEGKGAMDTINRFMKTLEADNPPMRIDGFNLKPQGKESDELKFSFSIIKLGVKEKSLDGFQS